MKTELKMDAIHAHNKMKNQKTIITIAITLVILIAILIFVNLPEKKEPETYEELGYKPINENNIIGTWKAVSEQFGFSESVNTNLKDYEIIFNKDNTYSSLTFGISESGFYSFKDDRIYFYEKEEYMSLEGNFLQTYGWIKGNELVLTFPQFPKTITYRSIDDNPAL